VNYDVSRERSLSNLPRMIPSRSLIRGLQLTFATFQRRSLGQWKGYNGLLSKPPLMHSPELLLPFVERGLRPLVEARLRSFDIDGRVEAIS
jgi:hypothetical protein